MACAIPLANFARFSRLTRASHMVRRRLQGYNGATTMKFLYLDTSDIRTCKNSPEKLLRVRVWMEANGHVLVISPIHVLELEEGGGHEWAVKDIQWIREHFPEAYLLPAPTHVVAAQLEQARHGCRSCPIGESDLSDLREFASAEAIVQEGLERASFLRGKVVPLALLYGHARLIGAPYTGPVSNLVSKLTWREIQRATAQPGGNLGTMANEQLLELAHYVLRRKDKKRSDPRIDRTIADVRRRSLRDARRPWIVRRPLELALLGFSFGFSQVVDRVVASFMEYDVALLGFSYFWQHWKATHEAPRQFLQNHPTWQTQPIGLLVHARAARLRNAEQRVALGALLDELHILYAAPGSRMTLDRGTREVVQQALAAVGGSDEYDCFVLDGIGADAWTT